MQVVKAAKVEDFKGYITGRVSQTLKHHIALFLAKLSNATTASTVKYLCVEEKGWFENQYGNNNTRASHMTKYRKAITSMTAERTFPASVLYEQETQHGLVRQHIALKWMNYSSEFHQQRQAPTQQKAQAQRRERVAFEPQPVIDAAVGALESENVWEVAAALILLTGRRPTEILKTAEFSQAGPYQLDFRGQLKRRVKKESGYRIYCLVRAHRLLDVFTRFRGMANIRELQAAENAAVDSRLNATVNQAVRTVFPEEVLRWPLGEEQLSAKNLRASYTNIAYHLFGTPQMSIGAFAEEHLGHQNAASAASYEDYYCVDGTGKPLAIGLLRSELAAKGKASKSKGRTSIAVDGRLKERFSNFGKGTHKERLEQLLDAAEDSERLARQLSNAESRLRVAKDHIQLLQEQKSALEAQLQHEAVAALVERIPAASPEPSPIPADWRDMSNAALNGSQIPGSADEKVRRSIEAIEAYNAGREPAAQWAITPTVLQKLSGSNANRVKEYLERHPETVEQLAQYNQDFGYHQNRGKGEPRQSIKWPVSYGEYEWSSKGQ